MRRIFVWKLNDRADIPAFGEILMDLMKRAETVARNRTEAVARARELNLAVRPAAT
jgi:hypothetical protein